MLLAPVQVPPGGLAPLRGVPPPLLPGLRPSPLPLQHSSLVPAGLDTGAGTQVRSWLWERAAEHLGMGTLRSICDVC